jgi:uncharacterized membrane protein YkgB
MATLHIDTFDEKIIHFLRRISVPAARIALFVVFFWFGILKVLELSPAGPLVIQLLQRTIPFMNPELFLRLFGGYEMLIGLVFLIPKGERTAIALLVPHMIMTFGPLVLLPQVTWSGFMVPTLEGQYIIKNLVIIAAAFGIAAHLHPLHAPRRPARLAKVAEIAKRG